MKKIVCLLFVFLMLPSFLLWAAGGKEEVDIKAGEKVVKGEKYHFILSNNMISYYHFFPDYEGIQLACEEISALTGDEVTWEVVGPTENDLLKAVEYMEAAIAKKPDGFMVIAWEPSIMKEPINKAVRAGIPVITIDADSPESDRLCYIGTDWYPFGEELGKALVKEIGGKGKVAMMGIVGSDVHETAFRGFRDYVKNYPDIKIVTLEDDRSSIEEAARITKDLLIAYPDLKGIAGFSAASGAGMSTALREAGKAGKVKVVNFSVNVVQLQALENNEIQFVVGQRRKLWGYWGVLTLYVHLKSGLQITHDDASIGLSNLPPRIITGFLPVTEKSAPIFMDTFEKYTDMKFEIFQ